MVELGTLLTAMLMADEIRNLRGYPESSKDYYMQAALKRVRAEVAAALALEADSEIKPKPEGVK